jgi:FMN-dependent NADH-azoreductase
VSRQVSGAIVEALAKANPGLEVTRCDLVSAPLPHLTPASLPGAHPLSSLAPEGGADRAVSDAVLEEFLAADIVVIGAPMYNFGVPSQLKAWIDRVLVPGKTFRYGPAGPEGLAGDKRVILAISRGGLYGPDSGAAAFEHAEAWLRVALGFIGVNPEVIVAEGVQRGGDIREAAIGGALQAAAKLAA